MNVLLVPLVAAVIFAMSLGTNRLGWDLKKGVQPKAETAVEQDRTKNLEEQLANERRTNELLRKLAGLPQQREGGEQSDRGLSTRYGAASHLEYLLGFFVQDAHAQDKPLLKRPTAVEQKKILEELHSYKQEQKRLREEERKLQERQEEQRRQEQRPLPSWRRW